MVVLYLVIVVAVLLVAAVVATREDDVLVDVPADAPDSGLPDGPLLPEDVAGVRLGMVLRGYRMAEVDAVLARLAGELAARDARIGELEQALVDVVEPQVAQVEQALVGVAEPAATTELTAPTPEQVHVPVTETTAPDDDLFPEVWAPEPAPADLADAVEEQAPEPAAPSYAAVVEPPAPLPSVPEAAPHEHAPHEHAAHGHTGPEPVLGWPGEGSAVEHEPVVPEAHEGQEEIEVTPAGEAPQQH